MLEAELHPHFVQRPFRLVLRFMSAYGQAERIILRVCHYQVGFEHER